MRLTEFQVQKLTHKFRLLDIDGNGVVDSADFDRVVQVLALERSWTPDHPRYAELVQINRRLWSALFRFCDIDEDGQVTLDEWIEYHANALFYERELGVEIPGFGTTLDAMADFFYELLDSDGDGTVQERDYVEFCVAHGLPEQEAQAGFSVLDRNGDGWLSKSEVLQLVREFYYSDEPDAPGSWFFGGL